MSSPIIPGCGLRQGDPISPYLFLFCADAFLCCSQRQLVNKLFMEQTLCNGTPRISHLFFFADDNFIFVKANMQKCSNIVDIISLYERVSGRKVNLSKTEVAFSKNSNYIPTFMKHITKQFPTKKEIKISTNRQERTHVMIGTSIELLQASSIVNIVFL